MQRKTSPISPLLFNFCLLVYWQNSEHRVPFYSHSVTRAGRPLSELRRNCWIGICRLKESMSCLNMHVALSGWWTWSPVIFVEWVTFTVSQEGSSFPLKHQPGCSTKEWMVAATRFFFCFWIKLFEFLVSSWVKTRNKHILDLKFVLNMCFSCTQYFAVKF